MLNLFAKPRFILSTAAALACVFAPAARAQTVDMAEDVKSGEIWEQSAQDFQNKYNATRDKTKDNVTYIGTGGRVEWLDAEKTSLRITKPAYKVAGLAPGETIVKFQDDKPVNLQIMLYNKGDDRVLVQKDFTALISQAQAALSSVFENPGKEWKPKASETAVRLKAWQWNIPNCLVSLEYNSTGTAGRFYGEFIRIRITHEKAETVKRATKKSLADNVRREGGRVYIENIPMVDQGEKGYCAAAACARVFMYYGFEDIDQHDLASAAKTTGGGGTNPDELMDAVKKLCIRFNLRMQQVDSQNNLTDYNKLKQLIAKYNNEAKRLKAQQIDPRYGWGFWYMCDENILKSLRIGRAGDDERWLQHIRNWIDKGVPILWALQLGLVPEPLIPQMRGGHMRMIVGYDDEKKAIIFSDTWGEKHTFKDMPVQDAMVGTMLRLIVEPRQN